MAPRAATTLVLFAGLLPVACFPPGEGIAPPDDRVYFPVGLAVDEQKKFLFIVNSDFDLQFNAGTVQSWDLDELRRRVPRYCESDADCADGRVCDLPAEEQEFDRNDPNEVVRHTIDNELNGERVPSHWCVAPGRVNSDDEVVPGRPCGVFGQQDDRARSLYPGRCGHIDHVHPQDFEAPIMPDDAVNARRAAVSLH